MEAHIGTVTHYYNRIGVAVLKLAGELRVGDKILILGHTTDLAQGVGSMEINHHKILFAGPGSEVAIQVDERVRAGDAVFRVVEGIEQPALLH